MATTTPSENVTRNGREETNRRVINRQKDTGPCHRRGKRQGKKQDPSDRTEDRDQTTSTKLGGSQNLQRKHGTGNTKAPQNAALRTHDPILAEEVGQATKGEATKGGGKKQVEKGQQKGKQAKKGKGGGKGKAKQPPTTQKCKDSMERLEEQLQETVDVCDLATRYGLEYEKLTKTIGEEEEIGEDKKVTREARRNVSVLKGIQRYLKTARAAVKIQGNKVHLVLHRLPGTLLTIEEKRCESLYRTGRRLARNYTKLSGNAI